MTRRPSLSLELPVVLLVATTAVDDEIYTPLVEDVWKAAVLVLELTPALTTDDRQAAAGDLCAAHLRVTEAVETDGTPAREAALGELSWAVNVVTFHAALDAASVPGWEAYNDDMLAAVAALAAAT